VVLPHATNRRDRLVVAAPVTTERGAHPAPVTLGIDVESSAS
jgi:hypothetical protein